MNTKNYALSLSLLAGACALLMPATSHAGNVGYYQTCGSASPAAVIALAGHTPVGVTSLDSASLASLDGLVIAACGTPYQGSSALNTAVTNGLRVLIDTQNLPDASTLPGSPVLTLDSTGQCDTNVSITPGAPVTNGPGGTLTDTSLVQNMICSAMGSVADATLPAGGQSLVKLPNYPGRSAAVAYPQGAGLVALSISQWMFTLPGGGYESDTLAPGVRTYYANTIAWMLAAELTPSATCASEGYKGAQLTWCQNICENGLTGQVLDTWIHRWIKRYRDLPYCAVEQPEEPPQET